MPIDTDFETGTPSSIFDSLTGAPTISTEQAVSGTKSLKIVADVGGNALPPGGTRVVVGRAYVRVLGGGAGSASVITLFPSTSISMLYVAGQWAVTCPDGNVFGAAAVADTWYRLDFRLDATANPWAFDWQVDGVAQTAGSGTLAASDITRVLFGQEFVYDTFYVDDAKLSYTSGDYPLGAVSAQTLYPASITTVESVGTPIVDLGTTRTVRVDAGIVTAEAFGTAALTGGDLNEDRRLVGTVPIA